VGALEVAGQDAELVERPALIGLGPRAAQAIQGQTPPTYNDDAAAPLFTASSPARPSVSRPNLSFEPTEPPYDEVFRVRPGPELFTGIVLQWGDEWEATAEGQLTVGGNAVGPNGLEDTGSGMLGSRSTPGATAAQASIACSPVSTTTSPPRGRDA
jgi:hypothetical protein